MINLIIKGAAVLALIAVAATTFAKDTMSAEEFVEEASAKGIAEIETAKIALETSNSQAVTDFARKMIQDHTAANNELTMVASKEGLDISDEAGLMNKAKALILNLRDGESFDVAYANNQVAAHKQTIDLFKKASRSENPAIRSFATEMLPKLKQHLKQARQLVEITKREEKQQSNRDNSTNENDQNAVRDRGTHSSRE